jgi:hypothetical protein
MMGTRVGVGEIEGVKVAQLIYRSVTSNKKYIFFIADLQSQVYDDKNEKDFLSTMTPFGCDGLPGNLE